MCKELLNIRGRGIQNKMQAYIDITTVIGRKKMDKITHLAF
jgi:hypothetical protein